MRVKGITKNSIKRYIIGLIVGGMSIFPSSLAADNWTDTISMTGFMSAKYHNVNESNASNSFDGVTKDGSAAGTLLGINLSAVVSDRVSLATQFFTTQEEGNYATHLDWAIASYMLSEDLKIRVGKLKFTTGLVSEYVDVGNSYPWINAPKLFYTESASGPNVTRESYSGASVYLEKSFGDLAVIVDVYGGEMELESMTVKRLTGTKFKLNWDDAVNFQITYYRGLMTDTTKSIMERKIHSNIAIGLNFDFNNVIGYAEYAKTDMQLDTLNGTSGYVTLGYQIDEWLPHLTYQRFEKGSGTTSVQEQTMSILGLRYDISDSVDIKFEYCLIGTNQGNGLFESTPTDKDTNMFGVALDLVF